MKVELTRKNKAFHFEALDSEGFSIQIDGNPQIGGEGKGTRPMELLLMSIGGCASIDLGLILKKQRQELIDYKVEVEANRNPDTPKDLREVRLHFHLWGQLDASLIEKAIVLTVEKYCSVILSLNPKVTIDYSYTINPVK